MNKFNDSKYNQSELFKNIYPLVKDKSVLDIGCVEHTSESKNKNPFWVHEFLNDCCNVLGIDILEKDVNNLRNEGYNMRVANAETFMLDKKFDVVFAGELIEHLSNPGLFLQRSRDHLKDNGYLLLTTPNAFYPPRLLGCIRTMADDPTVNEEHTSWFSPTTLKTLLNREGFDVLYIKRFDATAPRKTIKSKAKKMFGRLLNKEIKGSLLVIAKMNDSMDKNSMDKIKK